MKKVFIALAISWLVIFLFIFDSFYFIENPLSDKLTDKARSVDPRIKILAIDDESLEKIGEWPWPRDLVAETIEKIASNGAVAVWPDILYTEKSLNPAEDEALSKVVEKYDNVYLPAYFEFNALQNSNKDLEHEYMKWPVVNIPDERVGHINVLPDKDSVVRDVLLGVPNLKGEIVPIIDVRLANLLLSENNMITWDDEYVWYRGNDYIPVDEQFQIGFSYASSATENGFEVIPIWKVIEGKIDPGYFKDCVVMIGPYSSGLQEMYKTPIGKTEMSGVEIHANIIQALLDNKLYTHASHDSSFMIITIMAILGFMLFEWKKARLGAVILVGLIVGYTGIVYIYFHSQGVLMPYFYVIFSLLIGYVVSVIDKYLTARKEKSKLI
ncbi:MAG: CHASE2 domain-containing protein [Eubacteriales bacterium]